ncbi:MAG TPA: vWA domain-containing protein [Polyangiaceae bacterium]|nr:vWA domain-containing protein [Polyangiaceae bacterium]
MGAGRLFSGARWVAAAAALAVAMVWAGAAEAAGVLRTVLVIDASSSMLSTDPKELRKVAAELYVDLARDGDELAVTGFDGAARESTGGFTTIRGLPDRDALKQAVRAVGKNGSWTDFTAGLLEAKRLLDAAPDEPGDQEFIVFLTDGRCDPDPKGALAEAARAARAAGSPKRVEEICQEKVLGEILPSLGRARVFAVGLSKGAPRAFLETLGQRTGGVGLATEKAEELPRVFADVFARLLGSRLIEGESAPAIDIAVGEGMLTLDVIVVGPPALSMRLTDPAGREAPMGNQAPAEAYFADNPAYRLLKVTKPSPGTWKLGVGGPGKGGRYAVLQNLDLRLELIELPDVMEIGKPRIQKMRLATPGGKMPPSEFLSRHELTLLAAEAPSKCEEALRGQVLKGAPRIKVARAKEGHWEHTLLPLQRGEICFEVVLAPLPGGVLSRVTQSKAVRIVPPLRLTAKATPFGSVKQGQEAKAEISFDGSELGEAVEVDFAAIAAPGAPSPLEGLSMRPRSAALEPGGKNAFELVIAADRDAKGGDRSIEMRVTPSKPKGYEDRATSVVLSITIVPLTFWERYGFWVKVISGSLVGLLLLIGIAAPARFRKGTMLYYKDTRDPDLPREGSYPLAAKAKAGFYRGAKAMLGPTGPVRMGGVVELLAGPGGGVMAKPLGGRKAREVPRDEEGYGSSSSGEGREVALKNGVFRVAPGARYAIDGAGLTFWVSVR